MRLGRFDDMQYCAQVCTTPIYYDDVHHITNSLIPAKLPHVERANLLLVCDLICCGHPLLNTADESMTTNQTKLSLVSSNDLATQRLSCRRGVRFGSNTLG